MHFFLPRQRRPDIPVILDRKPHPNAHQIKAVKIQIDLQHFKSGFEMLSGALSLSCPIGEKNGSYRKPEDEFADVGANRGGDAGSKLDQSRQELFCLVHQRLRL